MEIMEKNEIIDKKRIGKRLKELRKEQGLTQKQISERLNITRNAYTCYETGVSLVTLESAIKLAEMYKCSIDYLIGRYKEF